MSFTAGLMEVGNARYSANTRTETSAHNQTELFRASVPSHPIRSCPRCRLEKIQIVEVHLFCPPQQVGHQHHQSTTAGWKALPQSSQGVRGLFIIPVREIIGEDGSDHAKVR